ncbi:hypothetical protein D3C80_1856390 [compost metagenome]
MAAPSSRPRYSCLNSSSLETISRFSYAAATLARRSSSSSKGSANGSAVSSSLLHTSIRRRTTAGPPWRSSSEMLPMKRSLKKMPAPRRVSMSSMTSAVTVR